MSDIISRAAFLRRRTVKTGVVDDWAIEEAANLTYELAIEKYVYSVQVFMSGRWIFMVTLNTGNSLEEAAKWFPSRERAEYFASLWEPDAPARVVKRRVSPVEVAEHVSQ